MTEFPPQQPVIPEEALPPQEPVQVNYAALRDTYRALQNGTADRETLLGIGAELEANALHAIDENGVEHTILRGSTLRDEQGNEIPGHNGEPRHANIPKGISSAVYDAYKAARESNDPNSWRQAARIDEVKHLSLSQAKELIKSLNAGESFQNAVTAASEAPAEELAKTENEPKAEKAKNETTTKENEALPAGDPVSEALKAIKNPGAGNLEQAINELNNEQLEAVAAQLTTELSESMNIASPESAALDPQVAAKGIDRYLEEHIHLTTPLNVQSLHRRVVGDFLDRVAASNPDVLATIVKESNSSFVREAFGTSEQHEATIETRREIVAPQAGDVAVKSQLPQDHYDLVA